MTNEQKYRTAEERVRAFLEGISSSSVAATVAEYFARWLALEAEEEKQKPCPSCKSTNILAVLKNECGEYYCECGNCGLRSSLCDTPEEAKGSYNRMARAVKAANESEVK